MRMKFFTLAAILSFVGPLVFLQVQAQSQPQPPSATPLEEVLNALPMRNIGPFRTSAWITDIAVPETPLRESLYTIYAASRNGGLYRTINGGLSWTAISDAIDVPTIGAVAVAPTNSQLVWVGTGDQANARSSSSGKGVFKSTDAGKTWQFMGLGDSHHIARILIHPKNPDIVFVAALGHLFSHNEERGIFRTSDGGKTWSKVLYVDDGTGAAEIVMNRTNPNILFAAMYEKHRTAQQLILGGPGSGLYQSVDGGTTWKRLEGGLPSGTLGRIGVDIYQKNPNILYAVVENLNPRPAEYGPSTDGCDMGGPGFSDAPPTTGRGRAGNAAPPPTAVQPGRGAAAGGGAATAPGAAARGGAGAQGQAAAQPGRGRGAASRIGNEVYRSDDGGRTWKKAHAHSVDVAGGKAPYSFNQLRIDTGNPDRVIVTSDQMYVTVDGGKTWGCTNQNGFFRGVFGDFRSIWWDPQDNQRLMIGSDGGVNYSFDGGRTASTYLNLPIMEVYAIGVDMDDPYNVYGGAQDHDSWKTPSNSKTGLITVEQWTTVGPGDGMYNQVDPTDSRWVYNTRELGNHGRFDQLTGQRTVIAPPPPEAGTILRYNWIAPIVLSPHNPHIIYAGSQFLHRSLNQGNSWEVISGDLTTNTPACGRSNSGNVPFCNITTISESPLRAGMIWAGTDDGKVHLTMNGGVNWTDMTQAIAGAGGPVEIAVSRVFASPHDANTAFVSKSGFRRDEFKPYLFRTTDAGKTWQAISANLPNAPINVVVQDRKNKNLLIVGNDIGVFVSIDNGASWARMRSNLPTVPVHDLTIHPRENDLVLGTYGRAIWTGDITPLQDLTPDTFNKTAHLFDMEPRARYGFGTVGNYNLFGTAFLEIPNEPEAIMINYYLKADAGGTVPISVTDASGRVVRTFDGPGRRGFNRVQWPIGGGGGRGGGRGAGPAAGPLPVGDYTVTLTVGADKLTKAARIRERIMTRQ
jgi:photosystem II stability/assembly factor-like uncharacterized protein